MHRWFYEKFVEPCPLSYYDFFVCQYICRDYLQFFRIRSDICSIMGVKGGGMMERSDDEIREKIRQNLKMYRKAKDLTQEQLSALVGLPPTTVASWEQGKSLPSVQMLYHLSKLYGLTMDEMYGEGVKE